MLFVVIGKFGKPAWDSAKKGIKNRKKKVDLKILMEMVSPGDLRFTGVYDSKDATSLYKYLKRLEGLSIEGVSPALPLDNVLIIDDMAAKAGLPSAEGE